MMKVLNDANCDVDFTASFSSAYPSLVFDPTWHTQRDFTAFVHEQEAKLGLRNGLEYRMTNSSYQARRRENPTTTQALENETWPRYPTTAPLPLPTAEQFEAFMPRSEHVVLRSSVDVCGESILEVYMHKDLQADIMREANQTQSTDEIHAYRPEYLNWRDPQLKTPLAPRFRVGFRLIPNAKALPASLTSKALQTTFATAKESVTPPRRIAPRLRRKPCANDFA